MSFYLKYRPQKIADLDLPDIRQSLGRLLEKEKTSHALLLVGPRGSGKTSAARIIAKAVNCLKNEGRGEPCNQCLHCEEITSGRFLDLIEIDAASNRGIDDVRTLRENVKLAPAKGRKKVYIIDEVHMLTTEAFNALLKTLEEPPAHVIFILCTTEQEKLPETIISRCLKFNFRKASPAEVISSLKKVVKGEELKVEKGALELIAEAVDGSFRDGQKILDQLLGRNKEITLAETQKLLNQGEIFSPLKLIAALAERDTRAGLVEVARLMENGADLKAFLFNFLKILRQELMSRIGVGDPVEPEWVKSLSSGEIRQLIRRFCQAGQELKSAVIPQLPLELAVIDWGETERRNEEGKIKNNKAEEKRVQAAKIAGETKSGFKAENSPFKAGAGLNQDRDNNSQGQSHREVNTEEEGNGGLNLNKINGQWSALLSQVKPLNHSVEVLLRTCRPDRIEDGILTIRAFYQFHKERLESVKCREIVESAASQVFDSPIKIRCILGKREKPVSEAAPVIVRTETAAEKDILVTASQIFNGK
ncbi:MAG: DNA polymerase III subunit gamma/tau [Candidatus Pacebacteria bacterium]|nr:DNA polymerase III subunit gamma/tau [Candidatus Paceibacterota bacterium]